MKYRLTKEGKHAAFLLLINKKSFYSVRNKILMILSGNVNYTDDELLYMLLNDVSIKTKMDIGTIRIDISSLLDDELIEAVNEVPIKKE